MGEITGIQWCHATFNPWIGCTKVSPGCKNCYAETDMDNRRKRVTWGVNGTRSVTSYTYWRDPLRWNRLAGESGKRKRVFCASLADVFEDWNGQVEDSKHKPLYFPVYETFDEIPDMRHYTHIEGKIYASVLSLPAHDCENTPTLNHYTKEYLDQAYDHDYGDEELNEKYRKLKETFKPLTLNTIRAELFLLIERTPNLDWLLLTKRPENILKMVPETWREKFPDNVWIGTSTEDQDTFRERIIELISIPAKVRFLSVEPMLGPVKLYFYNKLTREARTGKPGSAIDWVICGGESGSKRRPFDLEWARALRDECLESGVPFFMKQVDKIRPIPEDLLIRQFPNE